MLNAAQQLHQAWAEDAIVNPGPERGFIPRGTPPRLHKITDRAARKAAAKALQRAREADPAAGFGGAGPSPKNHVHPRRKRGVA